ncbi:unnamed protein product, partial [Iphiclides podalirius]
MWNEGNNGLFISPQNFWFFEYFIEKCPTQMRKCLKVDMKVKYQHWNHVCDVLQDCRISLETVIRVY